MRPRSFPVPIRAEYSGALLMAGLAVLAACAGQAPIPAPSNLPASASGRAQAADSIGTSNNLPSQPAWQTAPALLFARSAHSVVSTDSAIYVLAGTGDARSPVLEIERFDGKSWTIETILPGEGLNAPAAVVLDNRIFLIGGFRTTSNAPSDEVLVYDLEAQVWSTAASLPAPRGGHGAVVLDGKIHVLGGGNSLSTIADHSVYDPSSDQWTELAPLTRAKGSPAVVVYQGHLYVIGGRSGSLDFGEVDWYDPTLDRWMPGPAIEPRGTAGTVVYHDAIYLIGGESQARQKTLGSVIRLPSADGQWEDMAPLAVTRNYARAVLFDGSIYVVGGSPDPGFSHSSAGSSVVERYELPTA